MSNSSVIKAQTGNFNITSDLVSKNRDSTNRESVLSEELSFDDLKN